MIKFGIFVKDKTVEFLYNNMFIIGKFYIHKCRFFKVTPNFAAFKNDLKLFSRSLKKDWNRKSLETMKFLICVWIEPLVNVFIELFMNYFLLFFFIIILFYILVSDAAQWFLKNVQCKICLFVILEMAE